MANPYSSACASSGKAKMRAIGGFKHGGGAHGATIKKAMAAHDKQQHGGKHTDLKAIGLKGGGRLDKPRRDKGGMHKRTKLNISAAAPPMPPDAMTPNAMPPPGMSAGPMPGPGMMKRGGFVKKYAGGGRIGKYPISGGADSGVGRLQLSKAQKRG